MTLEAQNALLKLLEEPPGHSLLILAAASEQSLLPTIRSRSQNLILTRPSGQAIEEYFTDLGYSEKDIKQAYSISGGLTGLMVALLADQEHPLKLATEWARKLLSQSAYERLLSVDELAKNKQLAINTAYILQQMAHVSLAKAQGKTSQKWQNILQAGYAASEALSQSAQPKLVLSSLMLSL
jgi:DNA polymerase-3 subunit delta'